MSKPVPCLVTHVGLQNWRNFRHVDVALQPRMFVVGPNASGKMNLLDALRFLHDLAKPEGNLVRAMGERGGIARVRSLHARRSSNVRITVTLSINKVVWEYSIELSGTQNRPLEVVAETVLKDGKSILDRDAKSEGEVSQRDAPGSDFIDQLAMLSPKVQTGALRRIERVLRIAVPRFSELKIERDKHGQPHLSATYEHWRPNGGWQNELDFSDGTLRLIGLLWAIDQGSAPLILEEPELSLHSDVIRQLPRMFSRIAQRTARQFLLSTHAGEMLEDTGIEPSEILLLDPTGESETTAVVGSDHPHLVEAARAGLALGQVVTSITRPKSVDRLSRAFRGK